MIDLVLECNDCARRIVLGGAALSNEGRYDGLYNVRDTVRVPPGWTGPWMHTSTIKTNPDGSRTTFYTKPDAARCPRCSREAGLMEQKP